MDIIDRQCPICGNGNLTNRVDQERVEYKGSVEKLSTLYSICDTCGSEQANSDQVRQNKRSMIAFKKQVDGLLSGADVRALRDSFELSQENAALVFGGGQKAFSKYENDDVIQSESMDKLLRVAKDVPMALDHLLQKAEIATAANIQLDQVIVSPPRWRIRSDTITIAATVITAIIDKLAQDQTQVDSVTFHGQSKSMHGSTLYEIQHESQFIH